MYVIKRDNDGKYVSRPGSEHSYTPFLQRARTFQSRASALESACENECVQSVADEMFPVEMYS